MSTIHGIASYFVPGLGHMIHGDKKEGVKYFGKNIGYAAGAGVASGIGTAGYMGISALAASDAATISSKAGKNIKTLIDKNPKAATIAAAGFVAAGCVAALGFGVASLVNHIKSVVSAGKLDKAEAGAKAE